MRPPGSKVHVWEMAEWAESEANRIKVMGRQMADEGMRESLHPTVQRRLEIAEATARFCRWAHDNEEALRRIGKQARDGKRFYRKEEPRRQ